MKTLLALFGENVRRYLIVVFSGGDDLKVPIGKKKNSDTTCQTFLLSLSPRILFSTICYNYLIFLFFNGILHVYAYRRSGRVEGTARASKKCTTHKTINLVGIRMQ